MPPPQLPLLDCPLAPTATQEPWPPAEAASPSPAIAADSVVIPDASEPPIGTDARRDHEICPERRAAPLVSTKTSPARRGFISPNAGDCPDPGNGRK